MTNREFSEWHDITGLCACGSPGKVMILVREILQAHHGRPYGDEGRLMELLPTVGILEFVIGTIDHWGLLEHGTCITTCWLTDQGREVLAFLDGKTEDEINTALRWWENE